MIDVRSGVGGGTIGTGSGGSAMASWLVFLGSSILQMAVVMIAMTMCFCPLAASRLWAVGRRQQRRARARVAAVDRGPNGGEVPWEDGLLVADLAERARFYARTKWLFYPPFVLSTLGAVLLVGGVFLRNTPPHGTTLLTLKAFGIIGVYGVLCALQLLVRHGVWRQQPRIAAVHHLMAALERVLALRADGPRSATDLDGVRLGAAADLGLAARYLRRMIGKKVPYVGGVERDNIRARSIELARQISRHQERLASGSRSEIIELAPVLASALGDLVEQRFNALVTNVSIIPEPGDGPPFTAQDLAGFRDEMARVHPTSAGGGRVLDAIGFPVELRPNIDNFTPLDAWGMIFHSLEHGVVPDPYRRLLAAVLRHHPANEVFRELAASHRVVAAPPRIRPAPSSARRILERWLPW